MLSYDSEPQKDIEIRAKTEIARSIILIKLQFVKLKSTLCHYNVLVFLPTTSFMAVCSRSLAHTLEAVSIRSHRP